MQQNKNETGRILLMNGPNLNMLGRRDPDQYGRFTLKDVEDLTRETAAQFGFVVDCFQSNHEGELIDRIQASLDEVDGLLINAGAFTHYSYALRDALELCPFPVAEVHISDIKKREPFRRISVIEDACDCQIAGHGIDSYRLAAAFICKSRLENPAGSDEPECSEKADNA